MDDDILCAQRAWNTSTTAQHRGSIVPPSQAGASGEKLEMKIIDDRNFTRIYQNATHVDCLSELCTSRFDDAGRR